MKSITIVIPNYNGMRYLEGCLKSLEEQTDQDFELLIIDNGSTDGSVLWLRSIIRRSASVRTGAIPDSAGQSTPESG